MSARATQRTAVHGTQHLDIVQRVQAEATWDVGGDQFDKLFCRFCWIIHCDEIKIAESLRVSQVRHMACIDLVSNLNDPAWRGLAKDFRQMDFGDGFGGDQIRQHLTGTHGG